jgi:hypothetical protein
VPDAKAATPDTKPATPDAKPATPAPGAAQLGLKLIRWGSEYDPDIWAAAHLLDGKADRGWCSSPSDKQPFTFVFELAKATRVASVSFDNFCPEEAGFEGVASSRFTVEGSLLGPERGYKTILSGSLESGVNGQDFELSEVTEHRYLRLSLLGNHGHGRLTELMEFRALAPPGESVAKPLFHLARARTSRERNSSAETKPFKAGERVWVSFKPRGLATNDEGSTWIEVDLVLADSEGNLLLRRNTVVNHVAKPPVPPLSPFVSLFLDLPEGFPSGKYVVRLVARDKVGDTSAAAKCEFLVAE